MKIQKLVFFLAVLFCSVLVLESCAEKANCGNKRQKKAQHARTKKMVGSGWVQ